MQKAQRTILAKTLKGIRTMLCPSLSRQCGINGFNLHYHHLAHPVFSNNMFASAASKRGNKCAQVYDNNSITTLVV